MAERLFRNQEAVGSTPTLSTKQHVSRFLTEAAFVLEYLRTTWAQAKTRRA